MRNALGLLIGLGVGAACRLAGIPLPAPEAPLGALLVVAITLGYLAADRRLEARAQGGGPESSPPAKKP